MTKQSKRSVRIVKPKSIILLSGGLDSTISAVIAKKKTRPIFALTFDHGQRAARQEILACKKICKVLKIKHKVVKIPFFKEFKKLVMLQSRKKVGAEHFTKLQEVWIPNRNGLFINIAACYAEYYGAELVITGFNRDEAREFSDNSRQFVKATNSSLQYSTLKKIKVKSYVLKLTKKEIYELGLKYHAPIQYIYSCYLGGKEMCGKCASCRRLKKLGIL